VATTSAIQDLLSLIDTWKKNGKVKTGDREKAVKLADQVRAEGTGSSVSGNGLCPPSLDATAVCRRVCEDAIATFTQKALAAIDERLNGHTTLQGTAIRRPRPSSGYQL
jgi:hypothetical protein